MNLERLEELVGLNNVVKIRNLNILIVGVGGVGGYTLESLVRSGVNSICVIDGDTIDETNLNRQIITNINNVGKSKVEEAMNRALSINKNINFLCYKTFLNDSNINNIDLKSFDYIVDACDTLETKALLINKCIEENIKIISSMGTAKKMDATKLSITTLNKTSYDALAKKLRKLVKKEYQKKVIVISSTEEINECVGLGSNSYVPAVAGLLITNYIINDICNKI